MKDKTFKIILTLWVFAIIAGGIGIITRILEAERFTGYGSYVPWGLWVAMYFHLIGIAGGVFAIGGACYLLNVPGFRQHFPYVCIVSGSCIITALFAIWIDLGHPLRAFSIMITPNFSSMMTFNAWSYSFFILILAACLLLVRKKSSYRDINDPSGWLVPLIILGIFASFAFPSQSGAFFGVVDAKPYWQSAIMPILFLISGLTAGSAALLLLDCITVCGAEFPAGNAANVSRAPFSVLRWITVCGIMVYFLFEFAEYSLAFWSPISHSRQAIELIMFGPFWWVFWIVHVGGSLGAIYLMIVGKSTRVIGVGGLITVITFISARLNILIPGQAISELKGLKEAFHHNRLRYDYQASLNEYLVALFIAALVVALAYGGIKLFLKTENMGVSR
ncbi:polysulfide reductase NrfD [Candidatus Magnetobacterium bavaricum]|uniref:Polysulfide reductase NrfD n=1 Tax=Candidatus Magnetobacterium bavaricum TaxID=29290 RepID=A0A0F3GRZ4_9BACT|nr:polysulfide reductase NrfD [Candidatus Magnetobacterium bavaricum]